MRTALICGEDRILAALEQAAKHSSARACIDAAAGRLEKALLAAPGAQMAWETVPLSTFDPGLPETIRSAWVFLLRGGHWVVLSFHTVPAEDLIEERPRGDAPETSHRRHYLGESAR